MRLARRLKLHLKKLVSRFADSNDNASRCVLKRYGELKRKKGEGSDVTVLIVGANNGVENDPFTGWVVRFGWKAILVEPNPSAFKQLQQNFGGQAGIRCLNMAVSIAAGKLTLHRIAFSSKRWATGLTSFSREVLEKHIDSGYIREMATRFGDRLPVSREEWIEAFDVQCDTVMGILKSEGIPKVEIVAIDVEGLDAKIVEDVLNSGLRPDVICWEHLHVPLEVRIESIRRLESLGYRTLTDANNVVSYCSSIDLPG